MYSTDPPFEDSTAEFSCDDGTSLVGERSAQCLANGTWNITDTPQCVLSKLLPLFPYFHPTITIVWLQLMRAILGL